MMRVVAVQVAERRSGPMKPLSEVRAVAGRGLEGDRFFGSDKPGRECTLIESEAVEALRRDYGVALDPREARRNIVTRGAPLNHLVGREFRVGEAVLRGVKLCEPCAHLAEMCERDVVPGLTHRGGLRAQIVSSGVIRVGDSIVL